MHVSHVVMLVANDITNDTRVLKEAVALGKEGWRVTLLGVTASGSITIGTIDGDVVMIRVPGRFLLRDERNRRRGRRRSRRILAGTVPGSVQAARLSARQAELTAESGRAKAQRMAGSMGTIRFQTGKAARKLRQQNLRLTRTLAAFRSRLAGYEGRQAATFWQRWDRWLTQRARPVSWRRIIPEAYDYEATFAQLLDRLRPDVLHAHDMHVIGVAVRAAGRASLQGRTVKVVYDAHEYVPGLSVYPPRTPRLIAAWAKHEREYIQKVDRVVTVSPAIAQTLQARHRLDRTPTVVINSPPAVEPIADMPDIRDALELEPSVPLMVYSGGITQARGVQTAIASLPHLPGVHLAVVCVPTVKMRPVDELRRLSTSLNVGERVHFLDPVPPNDVTHYLRTADVGLIPLLRYPSHEMALPNKVFEYVFAGLPVVTSDMPTLRDFVGSTGIGEVFEAENASDLAAKVSHILADAAPYRERVADGKLRHEMSWDSQAERLRSLYDELLGRPSVETRATRLSIAPMDRAVQWLPWLHDAVLLPTAMTHADLEDVTHLLTANDRSAFGSTSIAADLPVLAASRVKHGIIIDDPTLLPAKVPAGYAGPIFVTDQALADVFPGSQWLPPGEPGADVLRKFMAD